MSYDNTPKSERNRKIAAAYLAGVTMRELAEEYGVCPQRIDHIVQSQGAKLTYEQRRARHSANASRRQSDPAVRHSISVTLKAANERRRAMGLPPRHAIFADDPARRAEYLTLRDTMGAAYARQAMGLSA